MKILLEGSLLMVIHIEKFIRVDFSKRNLIFFVLEIYIVDDFYIRKDDFFLVKSPTLTISSGYVYRL